MKEEFLHYLWKYSLYSADKLLDNEGNRIIVINPGEYNRDSGPDFFNARISLKGTIWAGNVEIHTQSSHFDLHGHNTDPAFDNVILHVVAYNDKRIFNSKGEELLTVELTFDECLLGKYSALINKPSAIACSDQVKNIDPVLLNSWLSSLVIERMNTKAEFINKILVETGYNWEETFYRILTRYFGFRINTEPFIMLANALTLKIIWKHANDLLSVEALLYGTAGMLDVDLFREAIDDDYFLNLSKEYKILSVKYSLHPIHGWLWKFSRLRPSNFPTLRISQLAVILSVSGGLFSRIIEIKEISVLRSIFDVSATSYWDTHYVFGKTSRSSIKSTGKLAVDIFLINVVIPVLFLYGNLKNRDDICERAVAFLENIDAENNIITREWRNAGISTESAFYSQSLIHLRNEYCRKRRCLNCRIGNKIITSGFSLKADNELLLEPQPVKKKV
jgi:hypothetical protein